MSRIFAIALIALAGPGSAQAESARIAGESDFFRAYGQEFSPEARQTLRALYKTVAPYLSPDGLQHAIRDGFIPFTQELRYHGFHWFHPQRILAPADPTQPPGLNFDRNGRLVAVFWSSPKAIPLVQKFTIPEFVRMPLATQEIAERNLRFAFRLPPPASFAMFGNLVSWHSHENVVLENLGARDENGNYLPQAVRFRQGLTAEVFARTLATRVLQQETVVALLEPPVPALPYPHFNTAVFQGFHMMHLWVGLKNPEGAFAGTHPEVSSDALDEHDTLEGSAGHHHTEEPTPFVPARSLPARELATQAFQGRLIVAKIPAGAELCTSVRSGTVTARQIAESGFLLGRVSWKRLTERYTTDLAAALKPHCET